MENVNEMVLRMQYSGYSKKFRYEVVNSALKAYETRKKADQEGERRRSTIALMTALEVTSLE